MSSRGSKLIISGGRLCVSLTDSKAKTTIAIMTGYSFFFCIHMFTRWPVVPHLS